MSIGNRLWILPATLALLWSLPGLPAAGQQEQPSERTRTRTTEQQSTERVNQAREQNRARQDQIRREQEQQEADRQRQSTDRSANSANRLEQSRDQQTRDQYGREQSSREQTSREQSSRDQYGPGQQRDQYGRDQQPGRLQSRDQSSRDDRFDRSQQGQQSREQAGGNFRQRLGIELGQQTQGQGGLSVANVQQGTAAARAGLRSGDVIVSIDGRNISNQNQFFSYLSGQYGRNVPIVIWRGNRQYTVQLTPESQGDVAWLGVYLQDSEDNQGQSGARITQVYPAGPAARAGLYPGDVITSVEGQQVGSASDLISAIEEQRPGSRVELAVTRRNQQVQIPVTLGSRDSFVYRGQWDDQSGGQYRGGQYASSQSGEYSRDSGSGGENDYFADIPPFAMHLEHERRMYEQNQRLETEIAKLQDEVRQLREAVQNLRR